MSEKLRWHIYPDVDDLVPRVAGAIENCARGAIRDRGLFHIVLAGGSTPVAVYECLRDRNAGSEAWHVYFGDERCLPVGDSERNDKLAREAWLDYALLPPQQIYPIPGELGPEAAAAAYAEIVRPVERFDLVLLGLGEDGHTASLFPGHEPGAGPGAPETLAVHGSPKPPSERVSLSAARLSRTRQVFFLVPGAGKREALQRWRHREDIPARHIQPQDGIDLFVDAAAVPGWK